MLCYNLDEVCYSRILRLSPGFPGGTSRQPGCQSKRLRKAGSFPASGRSPERGHATQSSSLAWRTPWAQGPVGQGPRGCEGLGTTGAPERGQHHHPKRAFTRGSSVSFLGRRSLLFSKTQSRKKLSGQVSDWSKYY